jgi:hypothetical protein
MGFGHLQDGQAVFGAVIGNERFIQKGRQKETALTQRGDYPGLFIHTNSLLRSLCRALRGSNFSEETSAAALLLEGNSL